MRKTEADKNSSTHAEEYQNNTDMRNPNVQNNTVSQISGKISRMHKRLKPDVFSAICECWVQG